MSDAVLAVASRRPVEAVLQQLVDRGRERAGARYAAWARPTGSAASGRFRLFASFHAHPRYPDSVRLTRAYTR